MNDSVRPTRWPFRADIPQRYNDNADLYLARGGQVRLETDFVPFESDGDVGDSARFLFFCLMLDQIQKDGLEGHLAELGVYKGMTASVLATVARRLKRTLYLFDTFDGFRAEDLKGIDADKDVKQFTDTSIETVRQRIGEDCVQYVQGHFPGSTSQIPDDLRFCAVHIDCDLYEPLTAALHYFYPRLVPGGFIVIHDYSSLAWNGAERAVDEFFADKPEHPIPLTDGAGSAVVRRAIPAAPRVAAPTPPTAEMPTPPTANVPTAEAPTANVPTAAVPPPPPVGELMTPGSGWVEPGAVLAGLLETGWSAMEEWGVWGTGIQHVISIPNLGGGEVEIDCSAAIQGPITSQSVQVLAGGQVLDTWSFSPATNRTVRRIKLPPTECLFTLTFVPERPVRPSEFDPSNGDTRLLGMAVHALRIRPAPEATTPTVAPASAPEHATSRDATASAEMSTA